MRKILYTMALMLMSIATWADELPTITVVYNGTTATVTIPAGIMDVTSNVSGADVTLTSNTTNTEYCYKVSGNSSDGSLTINGKYKLTLELAGLDLTSQSKAAIDVECGKRIAVVLDEGTTNNLTDGKYNYEHHNACLYFKGHAEFEGAGTLNVTGNTKHAIAAKEYIQLKKSTGNINVLGSVSDGIHCKYTADDDFAFTMNGGTVIFSNVQGDYIDSDDNGVTIINGGTVNLNISGYDAKGIKAPVSFSMTGGQINANVTGASVNAISCGTFSMTGGTINGTITGDGSRGIKTDGEFSMSGGTFTATLSGANAADGEGGYDHCTGIKVANSDAPADMKISGTASINVTMDNDEAESYDTKTNSNSPYISDQAAIVLKGTKYTCDSHKYSNYVPVYAKVLLDGTPLKSYRKCQIGSFIGYECRGGGETYITANGVYATLPIRTDDAGDIAHFKVQNYDDGKVTEYEASNLYYIKNYESLGMPSTPYELNICSATPNEMEIGDETVTYTRNVSNNYGTIVLPFVPTKHENIDFYTISNVGEDVLTLSKVTDLKANTPYIYNTTTTDMSLSAPASALTVPTAEMTNSMAGFSMNGTYTQKIQTASEATNALYYISGDKFWHATGTLTTYPYRAWLEAPKTQAAKSFAIVIDDEVTGIAQIENGDLIIEEGKIYDLQGRQVGTPQRGGIYVVNGKKIVF